MSKCAGNIPEFDDLEEHEDAERSRRIHRPRKTAKRKRPVRASARRVRSLSCG